MNFMQDFSFEEEQNSPEYEKVQKALLKDMKELKILLNESEENLLIGQYENYLKSFAFLKFILKLMGELQELLDKFEKGDGNIRPSDLDELISKIESHISQYEVQRKEIKIAPKEESTDDSECW